MRIRVVVLVMHVVTGAVRDMLRSIGTGRMYVKTANVSCAGRMGLMTPMRAGYWNRRQSIRYLRTL